MDSLNDLYSRVTGKGRYQNMGPLSALFARDTDFYTAPPVPKKTGIAGQDIGAHIMNLESNMGTHPETPRMERYREYTIPAVNQNEKERMVKYRVGYGGWGGITPSALGEYHKSIIDRNAPAASSTMYGLPLLPGNNPEKTQELLNSKEGTQQLISNMFQSFRKNKNDFTPEGLTNDYMDYWVGKNNKKSYTPENRARVLKYFTEVVNQLKQQQ